jgi:hypothetical protein
MSLHDKFVWPKPDNEVDEAIFRNVRQYGCHIVNIVDGDPEFSFRSASISTTATPSSSSSVRRTARAASSTMSVTARQRAICSPTAMYPTIS